MAGLLSSDVLTFASMVPWPFSPRIERPETSVDDADARPAASSDSLNGGTDFAVLLHRHAEKAYNFAFRLCGNAADAADLVQEAAARALTRFDLYDPDKPFDAWLCRILHNVFVDLARRYERRHAVSLDAPPPTDGSSWVDILPGKDPEPWDTLARKEDDRLLQKALDGLPSTHRAAVVLCDVEGYSYERIAEILECPVGTVRSRIHDGRRRLKDAFVKLREGKVS